MGLKDLCLVVQSADGGWLLVAFYQGLTLEQILSNFFVSELDEGTECILSTFADDIKSTVAVIHGRSGRLLRRTSTAWGNGLTCSSAEVSPCMWEGVAPCASRGWGLVAGEQLCGHQPSCPPEQPAVCPYSRAPATLSAVLARVWPAGWGRWIPYVSTHGTASRYLGDGRTGVTIKGSQTQKQVAHRGCGVCPSGYSQHHWMLLQTTYSNGSALSRVSDNLNCYLLLWAFCRL